MLSILFELFVIIIYFIPLSSYMNILKDSLFSSSKKRKVKRSSQNFLGKYEFRQANHSLTDSHLYTFENSNIELETISSDEETKSNDEHTIRTRYSQQYLTSSSSSAHDGGSIVIIEKPILPNETIQAFAIRYRVPVSQLKRLNNLQNDQDFYALTYCRVPIRRFGLLHEYSESSLPSSTVVDLNEQPTISLPITHLSQKNHLAFLNAMDQDLASMRAKVEQLIETSSTSTSISNQLTSPSVTQSMIKPVRNTTTQFNCDEADCGCKFWHIIIIIIILVLIPFICAYFYIKYPHSN
ncbi:unnamed protein product [Rotaria sordida]|uniref:LysM domain-containing protein n=1 Tax=Rotaria sordida TaxID=392033 RepID=A0A815A902_9BILA|nr:unnamed protein product [Rotaria sordida]CAF4219030.1 unnamed protein product [Rotaria sordida]